MPSTPTGGTVHHPSHTLQSIHERIQQHAERLSHWESQFQQWQEAWHDREARLDRELAILECAAAPPATRHLLVVRDEDLD